MEKSYILQFFKLFLMSLYIYKKILNIENVSKWKRISAVIFSLVMGIILSYMPPFYKGIFVGSVFIFVCITARVRIGLMVTGVIVSIGMSLGIDSLTNLVMALVGVLIVIVEIIQEGMWELFLSEGLDITVSTTESLFAQGVSLMINFMVVFLFFKMKRLKKGFVFLQSKEGCWIGLIFSFLIMGSKSFLFFMVNVISTYQLNGQDTTAILVFFYFAIAVYVMGIHFWWRNHINLLYQQRLTERISEEYLAEIREKNRYIKSLSENNDFLSKAVHRDNKLVPAMYNAVADFLRIDRNDQIEEKGMDILKELNSVIQERKEMIFQFEKHLKPLPLTEIQRVDQLLHYMRRSAIEKKIEFEFILTEGIKERAENVISSQKLTTLLADFIENAIIAVSYSAVKKIIVRMGIKEGYFEIVVQDSGIPFEKETLATLGAQKSTTHAEEGGSGIGYMTIFDILYDCNASLIIEQPSPKGAELTKTIHVRFDEQAAFIVRSGTGETIVKQKEWRSIP